MTEKTNNNEMTDLSFVLSSQDACTPAALLAYADACDAHGSSQMANKIRDLHNAVHEFQRNNGNYIPGLETIQVDNDNETGQINQDNETGPDQETLTETA